MSIKYIFREVAPENCDFRWEFEGDCLNENSGDYCNTLFIVPAERSCGYNEEEYRCIQTTIADIVSDFEEVKNGYGGDDRYPQTYKAIMQNYGIAYSPTSCHKWKEWAETADEREPETVAAYLTLTTGKEWRVSSARGYCQGDYVEMVYCADNYPNGVKRYGELWLGAGREFCLIYLDDEGNEEDEVYGYCVADSDAWRDEDIKRLLCEWEGVSEEETRLEMIDDSFTAYTYRTA